MQYYERDCMPCMPNMGIPNQMYPMVSMPEQQLESMYPRIYHAVFPEVVRCCDRCDMTYGPMHIPTREQLNIMIDDVYTKVEGDVNIIITQESMEPESRQFGFGRRPLLRGLIGILLIRELLRRRRRPFFGFPFFGGGFGVF